ncbi:DUF6611 family protein [Amnibacterium setariae]|uniref:DUF6611 family protein n=1 Tax=Amnibacterium setariae TaxID=2306585 RepID=UPI0011C3C490|nr:DUF6611 family protein [Amnibacterium setariae]
MSPRAPLQDPVDRSDPLLVRLVAGPTAWGRLDVQPSRYGFTRYRLTVLPPGASTAERAWLAVWRSCPVLVAVLGFGLDLVVLAAGADGVVAAAAGGALAVVVPALVAVRTRRLRPLVRSRAGGVDDCAGVPRPVGDMAAIDRWWPVLDAADRALERGDMTPVEHELVWTAAWQDLATRPRGAHPGLRARAAGLLRQG